MVHVQPNASADFGTPIKVPFTVEDAPAITADVLHKLVRWSVS